MIINVIFLTKNVDNLMVIFSILMTNGVAIAFLLFDKDKKGSKKI